MKTVSTIAATPTTVNGKRQWIGAQVCDSTIDINWTVYLKSTQFDDPQGIPWLFCMIDNMANNGIITFAFGAFSFSVPQFSRKSFKLPDLTDKVTVNITQGATTLYFTETADLVSNDANLSAITTAAGTNVVYIWDTETAITVNQVLSTHANKNILFSRAGGQTFNLLATSTVPDGYINPIVWNIGNSGLTIVPNGTDVINSSDGKQYTNVSPLVVPSGYTGTLSCDGVSWYFVAQNWNLDTQQLVFNLPLAVAKGGTGATSLSGMRFGISNVTQLLDGSSGLPGPYTVTSGVMSSFADFMHVQGSITCPVNANGSNALIGMPLQIGAVLPSSQTYRIPFVASNGTHGFIRVKTISTAGWYADVFSAAGVQLTNTQLSGVTMTLNGMYSTVY